MHLTARLALPLFCAGLLLPALPTMAQQFDTLPQPVPMPAFQLPGLGGKGGSDADLRNKVTVIRFWASW